MTDHPKETPAHAATLPATSVPDHPDPVHLADQPVSPDDAAPEHPAVVDKSPEAATGAEHIVEPVEMEAIGPVVAEPQSAPLGHTMAPAAPRGGTGTPLWLTGALFVLLAGGLYAVWQSTGNEITSATQPNNDLHAVQQRLTLLEQRQTLDLRPLAARITALEAAMQTAAQRQQAPQFDASGLDRRITLLEQRPTPAPIDVAAVAAPLLAPLSGRIEAIEKKPAPDIAGPVSAASAALAARIDALDAKFTQELAKAASKVTTAARLRAVFQALESGKKLGMIPGAPPALAKFADVAPPTESGLRLRFPAAAEAAEAASRPSGAGQDFAERMWSRAQTLVTVRQGDHVLVGAPAAVTLAGARAKLDAGDLAGGLAALKPLDGPAAAAIAGWRADAQALLDARAALTEMAKS